MSRLSYLTRRGGGQYYVQLRMPARSGTLPLLRFSLSTSDPVEARTALFKTLTWLMPYRDAQLDFGHFGQALIQNIGSEAM